MTVYHMLLPKLFGYSTSSTLSITVVHGEIRLENELVVFCLCIILFVFAHIKFDQTFSYSKLTRFSFNINAFQKPSVRFHHGNISVQSYPRFASNI